MPPRQSRTPAPSPDPNVRILIAAVGRARPGPEAGLYDHFVRRLTAPLTLREVEEKRRMPVAERRRSEGKKLLACVPDGSAVVALDERGKALDSAGLAARLVAWREGGMRDVAFLIGGADGHDAAVTKRADLVLSLGAMTWPHLLVRAMLCEQLYRSQTIIAGHPYHRG